jgi:hypothetical protein
MQMAWPVSLVAILLLTTPVAGAVGLTIDATPREPLIGDTVMFSGSVSGLKTIAVYLFVTGPGLDPRGVTLDNLNIPTGRGLFTTAPVNMENGNWSYAWDTSVILGKLMPGNYTVHVVSSPVERLRFSEGESASVPVTFLPGPLNPAGAPLDPVLPLAACGIAGILLLCGGIRKR